MKILFLSEDFPPFGIGGSAVVAYNLAKGLKDKGHDVFVITTIREKLNQGEFESDGLKIFRIYSDYHPRWQSWFSLYNPQVVFKVKKIIKEIKPDIVHVHNVHWHFSYHCLKIAKSYARAVFLTAHDVMMVHYGKLMPKNGSCFYKISILDQIREAEKRYNPFRNIIIRHYLKYVDKIFAVSNAIKKILAINNIKNVETIYNGIDVENWKIDPEKISDFKKKYSLQNKKIILFAGRLSGAKGGQEILKAIVQIKGEIGNVILLVAGERNKYVGEMENLIRKLHIEQYVKFIGWLDREEAKSAFFASDVCITPSIYLDPFPTVNLEAMASKKPIIGTQFGGTPEIVVDKETGYLVNSSDTKDMADKTVELLKNPQKAKQFGEAGYKRVKENFSLQKQIEETLNFYHIFLKK